MSATTLRRNILAMASAPTPTEVTTVHALKELIARILRPNHAHQTIAQTSVK